MRYSSPTRPSSPPPWPADIACISQKQHWWRCHVPGRPWWNEVNEKTMNDDIYSINKTAVYLEFLVKLLQLWSPRRRKGMPPKPRNNASSSSCRGFYFLLSSRVMFMGQRPLMPILHLLCQCSGCNLDMLFVGDYRKTSSACSDWVCVHGWNVDSLRMILSIIQHPTWLLWRILNPLCVCEACCSRGPSS